jgi:hypothetical protein
MGYKTARYKVPRVGYFPEFWGTEIIYGRSRKREWLIAKVVELLGDECESDEDAIAALALAELCDMTAGGNEILVGLALQQMLEECGAGVQWCATVDALRRAPRTKH